MLGPYASAWSLHKECWSDLQKKIQTRYFYSYEDPLMLKSNLENKKSSNEFSERDCFTYLDPRDFDNL